MKKILFQITIPLFIFLISCSSKIDKSEYNFDQTAINNDSNLVIEDFFPDRVSEVNLSNKNKIAVEQSNDDCEKFVIDSWQFHHYEPVENKLLGIWPTVLRYKNLERLKELKTKWGFKNIFLQAHLGEDDFKRFVNAGFDNSEIMVHFNIKYQKLVKEWINRYNNVFAIYIDEPYAVQPNYTMEEFDLIAKNLKVLPNSKFVIGDFKPSDCLDDYVQFADNIMFSSYHRTYQLFGCTFLHWPENIDQRGSWEVMKERYGDKFNSTWIAGHKDTLEYFQLFKKASQLNLESVWFYQLEDSTDEKSDYNLALYCEAAWQNGYLKKINEKIRYEFICKNKEKNCECDKTDPNNWRLILKKRLDELKEEKYDL